MKNYHILGGEKYVQKIRKKILSFIEQNRKEALIALRIVDIFHSTKTDSPGWRILFFTASIHNINTTNNWSLSELLFRPKCFCLRYLRLKLRRTIISDPATILKDYIKNQVRFLLEEVTSLGIPLQMSCWRERFYSQKEKDSIGAKLHAD